MFSSTPFKYSLIHAQSFQNVNELCSLAVRECGLAHKTIIFVLDEFDLFAQV